jgi:exosortase/archaeosortase family protein
MKREYKKILNIFIRYIILIAVTFPNFYIFTLIFTPLTIYLSYFLFTIFFETSLSGNVIILKDYTPIEIIQACVASSAYYLLFVLNLSIPNIKLKKRAKMILFSFSLLLFLNILRIFILGVMYSLQSPLFDITHKLLWYLISIIFVVGIWFFIVKIFKVKGIPFYSDIKSLYNKSSLKK